MMQFLAQFKKVHLFLTTYIALELLFLGGLFAHTKTFPDLREKLVASILSMLLVVFTYRFDKSPIVVACNTCSRAVLASAAAIAAVYGLEGIASLYLNHGMGAFLVLMVVIGSSIQGLFAAAAGYVAAFGEPDVIQHPSTDR